MNAQALLWKYAEGLCTPEEQAEIERLIAADSTLKDELKLIETLQSSLTGMEPEQPSMRFVQNVMESLPALYTARASEPLISPVLKRIFWGAMAGVIVAIFLFYRSAQPAGDVVAGYSKSLTNCISTTLSQIPAVSMQYFALVFLAVAILILLDKFLAAKKLSYK